MTFLLESKIQTHHGALWRCTLQKELAMRKISDYLAARV
jgi:hypothetical protein